MGVGVGVEGKAETLKRLERLIDKRISHTSGLVSLIDACAPHTSRGHCEDKE